MKFIQICAIPTHESRYCALFGVTADGDIFVCLDAFKEGFNGPAQEWLPHTIQGKLA